MTTIRILTNEFNSRLYAAKERINKLKDNSIETTQSKAHRKRLKMENNEKDIKLYIGYVEESNVQSESHKKGKNKVEVILRDTDRIFKPSERHQITYFKSTVNFNQNKYQKQTNKKCKKVK